MTYNCLKRPWHIYTESAIKHQLCNLSCVIYCFPMHVNCHLNQSVTIFHVNHNSQVMTKR